MGLKLQNGNDNFIDKNAKNKALMFVSEVTKP
jgi:hypothetical protein